MYSSASRSDRRGPLTGRSPSTRAARGLPFHWAHDYPAALREFDKGLAEGPDKFYLDNDNEAAQAKLKDLIAADPTDRWAKVTLVWMYMHRTHRVAEAMALIDEMLKQEPESGELWLMRVQLLDANQGPGMRDAAKKFLRYADTNVQTQRDMIPIAKNWLATHPAPP